MPCQHGTRPKRPISWPFARKATGSVGALGSRWPESSQRLRGRRQLRVLVLVLAFAIACWSGMAGIAAGKEQPIPGVANVWLDPDGGSCLRSAKARPYISAQACADLPSAANAAAQGDIVLVRDGTYPGAILSARKRITIQGAGPGRPSFGQVVVSGSNADAPAPPDRESRRSARARVQLRLPRLHSLRRAAGEHVRRRDRGRAASPGRRRGTEGRAARHRHRDEDGVPERRDPRRLGLEGIPGRRRRHVDREHDVPRHPADATGWGGRTSTTSAHTSTAATTSDGSATGSCSAR